jgi:hypothetical protein
LLIGFPPSLAAALRGICASAMPLFLLLAQSGHGDRANDGRTHSSIDGAGEIILPRLPPGE